MNALTFVTLLNLTLLAPMGALAGPSDGGGTNLSDGQLVDFATFQKEFGGKQYALDPRKLKLKDGSVPYNAIAPLLSRVRYLYPGVGNVFEDTFDKDWILADATFTPRKSGEVKGISQTKDAVFVSLPWIRNEKPELVRQALVHEAVRNLADHIIDLEASRPGSKSLSRIDRIDLADGLTEDLTPAIFNGFPPKLLDQTMGEAFKKLYAKLKPMIWQDGGFGYLMPASRAALYRDLPAARSSQLVSKVCAGIDSYTMDTENLRKRIAQRRSEVFNSWSDYFRTTAPGPWFQYQQFAFINLDDSINALVTFLDDAMNRDGDDSSYRVYRSCQAVNSAGTKILQEYQQDQGKVHDPLPSSRLVELPDESPGDDAPRGR